MVPAYFGSDLEGVRGEKTRCVLIGDGLVKVQELVRKKRPKNGAKWEVVWVWRTIYPSLDLQRARAAGYPPPVN